MTCSKSATVVKDGQLSLATIIHDSSENFDGARLIAPSITCEVIQGYSLGIDEERKSGFQLALDGAYPLENPVLDLGEKVVYSVDMVRLEFVHDRQQKIIDVVDKQTVFCTVDSFTSNRCGTYRFMWTFSYADGNDGGYSIEREGEVIEDGCKNVVLKIGYGVVGKGGKTNNKGFVEFNPNKCEMNARKFLEVLYKAGCIFSLKRFDLAIDYSINRNCVRLLRDRRKYEYVLSSKGGATEYLGSRNAPGRVKVYDKAGEQGIDADITRVELTCDANWNLEKILEHLPICSDFAKFKGDGIVLALCTIVGDLLVERDEKGKPSMRSLEIVPERYFQILHKNTRYKLKKALKKNEKVIRYNDLCILRCVERAKSFVID